jgi:hypothetical protein
MEHVPQGSADVRCAITSGSDLTPADVIRRSDYCKAQEESHTGTLLISDCMFPPQMRRLTLDVASRVARMGRAEPHTWRASRGASWRNFHRNRYVEIE